MDPLSNLVSTMAQDLSPTRTESTQNEPPKRTLKQMMAESNRNIEDLDKYFGTPTSIPSQNHPMGHVVYPPNDNPPSLDTHFNQLNLHETSHFSPAPNSPPTQHGSHSSSSFALESHTSMDSFTSDLNLDSFSSQPSVPLPDFVDYETDTPQPPQYHTQQINITTTQITKQKKKEERERVRAKYIPAKYECKLVQIWGGVHKSILEQKKEIEKQCQDWHAILWSFPMQEKLIEGTCGCGALVNYKYNFRIATFNVTLFEQLFNKFLELHDFNSSHVFMSLFQQTVSELQLSRLIHSHIPRIQSIDDIGMLFSESKKLLDPLFSVLEFHSVRPVSFHSKRLVEALILFLGSYIVNSQTDSNRRNLPSSQPKSTPVLIDILNDDQSLIESPHQSFNHPSTTMGDSQSSFPISNDEVLLYFLEKLSQVQGFTWGAGLIRTTMVQTMNLRLLQTAVSNLVQFQNSEQSEFVNLLRQIPWKDFQDISTPQFIHRDIITPLKQIIDYGAAKNYQSLLLFVGNILLKCAYEFEDLAYECISAIVTGRPPMKSICSGILQFAPFQNIKREQLVTIFGTLYELNQQHALEYSKLPEATRLSHRMKFISYLLTNTLPLESSGKQDSSFSQSIEDTNAPPQIQPLIPVFYELAGHSSSGSQFQRLITQELFFFSFSELVLSAGNSPLQSELLFRFQQEARTYLKKLLHQFPELLSSFIYCTGQHLANLLVDNLVQFLTPSLFQNWNLDTYSTHWLGYFFAHRNFPLLPAGGIANNIPSVEVLVKNYLQSAPSVQIPMEISETGRKIGMRLFDVIDWKRVDSTTRFYCLLIIIGAKPFVLPGWVPNTLLGSIGTQLLSGPYDDAFVHAILDVDPHANPSSSVEISFLQVLLVLGVLEERGKNSRLEGSSPHQDGFGHAWLVSWGFYSRMESLWRLHEYLGYSTRLLIRMDVLKDDPQAAGYVKNLLACFYGVWGNSQVSVIQQGLQESLQVNSIRDPSPESNAKRFSFWLHATIPTSRRNRLECALFDDLIAYGYCSGFSLDEVARLVQGKNYSRNDIMELRNDRFSWIVLIALYSFRPLYPTNFRDKNNAFSLLQETALYEIRRPVAVAMWLHYFMMYFRVPDPNQILQKPVQDQLTKHFITVAKHYENSSREIYRLYYAFSSWKKPIIDSATGDFHEEQTIHLLGSIFSLLPPHFHLNSLNSYHDDSNTAAQESHASGLSDRVFTSSATESTKSVLEELLPSPHPPPKNQLSSEMERYVTLEHRIQKESFQLMSFIHHQQATLSSNVIQLPSLDSLLDLFHTYEVLSNTLGELDTTFLELTRSSHYNFTQPFQVQVPCAKGEACPRPGLLQGNSVRIGPTDPNIPSRIEANRKEFNFQYMNFFELAREMSQSIMVLSFSLRTAFSLSFNSNDDNDDDIIKDDRESSMNQGGIERSAVEVFFTVAERALFSARLPPDSAIISHLVGILLDLGRKYIKEIRHHQGRLLNLLLNAPSDRMVPHGSESSSLTERTGLPEMFHGPPDLGFSESGFEPPSPGGSFVATVPQTLPKQNLLRYFEDEHLKISHSSSQHSTNSPDESLSMMRIMYDHYSQSPLVLYELFTPRVFLSLGEISEYLQLLSKLTQHASQKSELELQMLEHSFYSESLIQSLQSHIHESYLQTLCDLIPQLLAYRPLARIGSSLLQCLVSTGHQDRAIDLLFSEKVPAIFAQTFLENLHLSDADLQTSLAVLDTFRGRIPLNEDNLDLGIQFVRLLTILAESFVNQFIQETSEAYDSAGKPVQSPLWSTLFEWFSPKGFLHPSTVRQASDYQIASILELLYDLSQFSPLGLVDKIWYLLTGAVFPALGTKIEPRTASLITRFASGFPWESSRVLLFDPNAVSTLTRMIQYHPRFVCGVFAKLDWKTFLNRLSASSQESLVSDLGLKFLSLFLFIHSIDSRAISPSFRSHVIPSSESSSQKESPSSSLWLDWSRIQPEKFAQVFTGSVLTWPVRSGLITTDPTQCLMENCMILKQIALAIDHEKSILGYLREVRSLMFFVVDCEEGLFWYLPFPLQINLLTTHLIPYTHQYAQSNTPESKLMTALVISTLQHQRRWPKPLGSGPYKWGTVRSYPGIYGAAAQSDPSFDQFSDKLWKLVLQFCSSAPETLAVNIFQVVPPPRLNENPSNIMESYSLDHQDSQESSMGIRISPVLWTELIEMTLRTFFSLTTMDEPLKKVASALRLKPEDRMGMMKVCKETNSSFTLLVVIEQWRNEVEQSHPSTQWPSEFFDIILGFSPAQYRSFDLLPLWFTLLELVQSPRFHPVQNQQDAWKTLDYFKDIFGPKSTLKLEPPMILAAKTVEIFFYRLIRSKRTMPNPKGDAALSGLLDKLHVLHSQPAYKNFSSFFMNLEGILDPLFGLDNLKIFILSSLLPTAQPMLEKLISSPSEQ